jgi:hypothetical protein
MSRCQTPRRSFTGQRACVHAGSGGLCQLARLLGRVWCQTQGLQTKALSPVSARRRAACLARALVQRQHARARGVSRHRELVDVAAAVCLQRRVRGADGDLARVVPPATRQRMRLPASASRGARTISRAASVSTAASAISSCTSWKAIGAPNCVAPSRTRLTPRRGPGEPTAPAARRSAVVGAASPQQTCPRRQSLNQARGRRQRNSHRVLGARANLPSMRRALKRRAARDEET